MDRFEDGGFSGDDRLQRQKPVLSGKDESFTPRAQGSGGIGLGEGPSVPAESVSNPVGVGAGDGDGLLGDGHGLLGPPYCRQSPGLPALTGDMSESGLGGQFVGDLQPAVGSTGETMSDALPEAAPSGFERVVARVGFQPHRGLGVLDGGFGASGERVETGGRVKPLELSRIGGGGRVLL